MAHKYWKIEKYSRFQQKFEEDAMSEKSKAGEWQVKSHF